MKARIGVGILMLFCAQLVSSVVFRPRPKVSGAPIEPTIDATKLNVPIKNRQAFLDMINYLRMETANYYQIPNMHQLTWDSDLEKQVASKDCSEMKDGPNYMFTQAPNPEFYLRHWSEASKEDKDETIIALFGRFIEPEATKIGCASIRKSCRSSTVEFTEACFLGPKLPEDIVAKSGTPGSQCRGGEISGGLCIAANSRPVEETDSKTINSQAMGANIKSAENVESNTASLSVILVLASTLFFFELLK